jgi:hypothetical protein
MACSKNKFCAIIKKAAQIGPEDWEMQRTVRVFDIGTDIIAILLWCSSLGIKDPTINSFKIAEVDM